MNFNVEVILRNLKEEGVPEETLAIIARAMRSNYFEEDVPDESTEPRPASI